jgi:hypothetical protein
VRPPVIQCGQSASAPVQPGGAIAPSGRARERTHIARGTPPFLVHSRPPGALPCRLVTRTAPGRGKCTQYGVMQRDPDGRRKPPSAGSQGKCTQYGVMQRDRGSPVSPARQPPASKAPAPAYYPARCATPEATRTHLGVGPAEPVGSPPAAVRDTGHAPASGPGRRMRTAGRVSPVIRPPHARKLVARCIGTARTPDLAVGPAR